MRASESQRERESESQRERESKSQRERERERERERKKERERERKKKRVRSETDRQSLPAAPESMQNTKFQTTWSNATCCKPTSLVTTPGGKNFPTLLNHLLTAPPFCQHASRQPLDVPQRTRICRASYLCLKLKWREKQEFP